MPLPCTSHLPFSRPAPEDPNDPPYRESRPRRSRVVPEPVTDSEGDDSTPKKKTKYALAASPTLPLLTPIQEGAPSPAACLSVRTLLRPAPKPLWMSILRTRFRPPHLSGPQLICHPAPRLLPSANLLSWRTPNRRAVITVIMSLLLSGRVLDSWIASLPPSLC